MKYLAIIIGLILVIPLYGQRKKKDDETSAPAYVEGIAYALPRTGIRLYVEAVKETFVPGPFAGYAEQLLGINNVNTRPSINWIISGIKIETFSEPDPDQVYKAMGDAAFLINLSADGRLTGINSGNSVSGLETIVTNQVKRDVIQENFSFDNINDLPLYIPGDSTNGYRPMRVSMERKAASAAKHVLDSRLYQYDLASGMLDELPPDGDAYKLSLKELKRIENDYLSLFTGKTTYQKEKSSFDFIPTNSSGKGQVIFRISDDKGIVPATDLSGRPVMIEFETEQNLNQNYNSKIKSANPAAGESGVYYRMPGMATIKIIYELNTIANARVPIAQFGTVAPLPEDLLYGEYAIEIHPETGAIKSVKKK